MAKNKIIVAGGVDEYIEKYPINVQAKLKEIRAVVEEVSPGAIQTVSYFQIPGYSYPGYDYNGMFAWFSFKEPHVRLHVRPPVINNHQEDLKNFSTTDSIVSFPLNEKLPLEIIKKLVLDSIQVMKEKASVAL